MGDPSQITGEGIVLNVPSDGSTVRAWIDEVLPDVNLYWLFPHLIEDLKIEAGVISAKGKRRDMKDEVFCGEIRFRDIYGYCAVYDGHGGGEANNAAAEYVRVYLIDKIAQLLDDEVEKNGVLAPEKKADKVADIMREAFRHVDERLHRIGYVYKKVSCFKIREMCRKVGSTAAVALFLDTHLVFATAGDSKIILARAGSIAFESTDHTPSNQGERTRIKKNKNILVDGDIMCAARGFDQHALTVSRGFGDFFFKEQKAFAWYEQAVSVEPDVTVYARDETDEFIVIASDGLWHFVTPEEVERFVRKKLFEENVTPERCAAELLELCFVQRESTDNISILILKLLE